MLDLLRNQIIHGDCFDILPQIPTASIDLLITDPPYGINFLSGQRRVRKHKRITNDDNLDWLEPFLVEAKRVLKEDAHTYIFCSHHNLDVFLSMVKKYLPYKNLLIWDKMHGGMGDLRGDFSPQHELIIFCSNGKKKLNGKRTSNVLKYKRTGNKYHPTEKPVDLIQFLIEKSTVEGDLVLDPFAGSGSGGTAAENIKRKYILIEKDFENYSIIRSRLIGFN